LIDDVFDINTHPLKWWKYESLLTISKDQSTEAQLHERRINEPVDRTVTRESTSFCFSDEDILGPATK
jgi:hypothetical protein